MFYRTALVSVLSLLSVTFLSVPFAAAVESELHGEYSLLGALHRTGGAGDKALLKRGEFFTHQLKLDSSVLLNDDWHFDTTVNARQTNDPQIELRNSVHLLGWTSELYNRETRATFGDFYGDFSRYVLARSLKGVQLQYKNETTELKGVAGYSQRQNDAHFMRYVAGGRAETLVLKEYGALQNVRVGTNFTAVEDDHASLTGSPTGVADASNRAGSVNYSGILFKNTELTGEIAKTWIDEDTSENTNVDRKTGTAVRANSATKFSKMTKARLGYEWVSADFNSLAGSAVPDRVTLNGRLDHKITNELASEASYRVSHNKLEKSILNDQTMTQTPHLALSWTPDSEKWLLRDYALRLFWDMRDRSSDGDGSQQVDFTSNDYGLENEFKVRKVSFVDGWTYRTEDDDMNKENMLVNNTAYFGMRMREKFGEMTAVPSVRYQVEHTDSVKLDISDFTQTVTVGLILEPSNKLKFEQRLSAGFAERSTEDADSVKLNSYTSLDYKLPTSQDLTFRISYEHLDFNHSRSVQTYSEDNLQTQLMWVF